jgi:hypothetical protein
MTASWRWLIGLGWGIPLVVAMTVAVAWDTPPGAHPFAGAGTALLLTAPVLPLSLVLLALAVVAGRRTRGHASRAFGWGDAVLLRVATAGIAVDLVLVAAAIALYVA